MKKFILDIFIIIAIGGVGALVALWVTHDEETKIFSAQKDSVKAFYSALSEGNWDEAASVCDTAAMEGYIENYRKIRDKAARSDSSILNLASSALAKADISFLEQNLTADDSGNAVFRINVGKNLSKIKTADLKLLDGKWLITNITTQN